MVGSRQGTRFSLEISNYSGTTVVVFKTAGRSPAFAVITNSLSEDVKGFRPAWRSKVTRELEGCASRGASMEAIKVGMTTTLICNRAEVCERSSA